jgi:hypothetical protein
MPRRRPSRSGIGTFSDDGDTIAGAWERADDGSDWEHDFDLVHTRAQLDQNRNPA